jgi:DNA-damage-inducible protein D
MEQDNKIVIFQEKNIRRVWHNEDWWYVVTDVVAVLADTSNPQDYLKKMRKRDEVLSKGWGQIVSPLSVETLGGKQKMNCASMDGLFRIIMSISSPKAEPFKLWLARVGKERMDEIENPELAAERARQYYRDLGYEDAWIEMRIKTIEVRGQLTDEWKDRGVREGQEYAILTAEISKATFGMTPTEYKDIKDLKKENLRDHMTNLELIFTMLGEETTRKNTVNTDAQGFIENKKAAIDGGKAAGKALEAYAQETGDKVVTTANFKAQIEEAKRNILENPEK